MFHSPLDAIRAGLGMVHQHFMLFNSLSVYENVIYGEEPSQYGFINTQAARKRVSELAEEYGLYVNPNMRVGELPVGVRQRVEIIKTLYRNAEILILDEPTAVLTPQEKDDLCDILHRLAERGKTILFITHKLNEVMQVSDRATVLRNGAVVTTLETRDTNPSELARYMVGRSVLLRVEKPVVPPGEVKLAVENVRVADDRGETVVRDISFEVRGGELVGIAGVAGNGQTELIEAIVGLRPLRAGRVLLQGKDVSNAAVAERREGGLAYVPEDRGRVGLALDARLDENLLMGYETQAAYNTRGILNFDAIRSFAQGLVRQYSIKAAGVRDPASTLSGGNLQKTVVARELTHDAPILIAEQPTRGVDIGSIEFIHQQLVEYQQRGHAILLVSAELSEIMALADRILVMYEGRIVGEVPGGEATEHGLGVLMTGGTYPAAVETANLRE
jgi:simple sugar transport system ATP-binding protein